MGRRKGGGGGVEGGVEEEVQEVEWGRSGGEVGRRGGISISSITCVTRNVQQWIMKIHKCQLSFENEGRKGGHSAY